MIILHEQNETNMTRISILFVLFLSTLAINAQQNKEENRIKKVIETFFEGLHKGDSTIMKTTLHKDIKIQTTGTSRDGNKTLRSQTRKGLLIGVAKKTPKAKYLEKLLSYDIKIDGNLASVWTPYEFYLNGNFSHCGANSFQLFDNNGKWEIIYLVDMRRREDCKALKAKK